MYLAGDRVQALLVSLFELAAAGSLLTVNFGVGFAGSPSVTGRVRARLGRRALARSQEAIRTEIGVDRASALVTAAGWRILDALTGPELGRRHLEGTGLPVDDLNPGSSAILAERP